MENNNENKGRVMCFDVGSRNLAWCVINIQQWKNHTTDPHTYPRGIRHWGKVDLLDNSVPCQFISKIGKKCSNKAKWVSRTKNGELIAPLEKVCGIHRTRDENIRKKYKEIPKRNTKTVSRRELHNILIDWLESEKKWLLKSTYIYIELQLSRNPSMKMISHIIYTWILIHTNKRYPESKVIDVSFISARYKLCRYVYEYMGISNSYDYKSLREKDFRKKEAVRLGEILVKRDKHWRRYYTSTTKKDDLADTLLMCLWQYTRNFHR